MLKKYVQHSSHNIRNFWDLKIQPNNSYVEKTIRILERKEKALRKNTKTLAKVLLVNRGIEEATWEIEEDVWKKYPHLFCVRRGNAYLGLEPRWPTSYTIEVIPITFNFVNFWRTKIYKLGRLQNPRKKP